MDGEKVQFQLNESGVEKIVSLPPVIGLFGM